MARFASSVLFPLVILFALPISSFSLQTLGLGPNFGHEIQLLGDAAVADDDSRVQITRASASSSGLLMYPEPFSFDAPTSFSTDFTFSISPGDGDGLLLVLFSKDSISNFGSASFGLSGGHRFVGVEFDTSMNANVGDLDANHVGIDVDSFVSATVWNASSMNVVLNSGEKLRSWIDYDASSKRIEVRLSRAGEAKPYSPIMAYAIDLPNIWGHEDVYIGLSSSNGNSGQTSSVYSWSFTPRKVPLSMHSMPVDPRAYKGKNERRHKERECPVASLAAFLLVAGCVLMSLGWLLRANVVYRLTRFQGDCPLHPAADFQYEKINVVVGKDGGDGKN